MALFRSNRRLLPILFALASSGLTACSSMDTGSSLAGGDGANSNRMEPAGHYGDVIGERFPVRAINTSRIEPRNLRQFVVYETTEHPGTIVIDTQRRFLYLVQEQGSAIRYGIGVGIDGLEFTGSAVVGMKREWPRWTPTADMIHRNPDLYEKWRGGMDGGPANPLGARALYLVKDGRDTLFRIHGTTEPHTIGKAVSSGCIRMFNHDVIDLYRRVPSGAKVVVLDAPTAAPEPATNGAGFNAPTEKAKVT